jgi:hypothetical protein
MEHFIGFCPKIRNKVSSVNHLVTPFVELNEFTASKMQPPLLIAASMTVK